MPKAEMSAWLALSRSRNNRYHALGRLHRTSAGWQRTSKLIHTPDTHPLMPILRITDAEGSRMHGLEGEVTTIGRGPGNSIILKDLASSSKHAQLLKDAAGWVLEDRGSLNG